MSGMVPFLSSSPPPFAVDVQPYSSLYDDSSVFGGDCMTAQHSLPVHCTAVQVHCPGGHISLCDKHSKHINVTCTVNFIGDAGRGIVADGCHELIGQSNAECVTSVQSQAMLVEVQCLDGDEDNGGDYESSCPRHCPSPVSRSELPGSLISARCLSSWDTCLTGDMYVLQEETVKHDNAVVWEDVVVKKGYMMQVEDIGHGKVIEEDIVEEGGHLEWGEDVDVEEVDVVSEHDLNFSECCHFQESVTLPRACYPCLFSQDMSSTVACAHISDNHCREVENKSTDYIQQWADRSPGGGGLRWVVEDSSHGGEDGGGDVSNICGVEKIVERMDHRLETGNPTIDADSVMHNTLEHKACRVGLCITSGQVFEMQHISSMKNPHDTETAIIQTHFHELRHDGIEEDICFKMGSAVLEHTLEVEHTLDGQHALEGKHALKVEHTPELNHNPEGENAPEVQHTPELNCTPEGEQAPEVEHPPELNHAPEGENAPEVEQCAIKQCSSERRHYEIKEFIFDPDRSGLEEHTLDPSQVDVSAIKHSTLLASNPDVDDSVFNQNVDFFGSSLCLSDHQAGQAGDDDDHGKYLPSSIRSPVLQCNHSSFSCNAGLIYDSGCNDAVLVDDCSCSNAVLIDDHGCKNAVLIDDSSCDNAVSIDDCGFKNAVLIDDSGCISAVLIDDSGCDSAVLIDDSGSKNAVLIDDSGCSSAVLIDDRGFKNAVLIDDSGCIRAVLMDDSGCDSAVLIDDSGSKNAVLIDDSGCSSAVLIDDSVCKNAVLIDDSGCSSAVLIDDSGCNIVDTYSSIAGILHTKVHPFLFENDDEEEDDFGGFTWHPTCSDQLALGECSPPNAIPQYPQSESLIRSNDFDSDWADFDEHRPVSIEPFDEFSNFASYTNTSDKVYTTTSATICNANSTYIRTVADILTQCFSLGTDDSVYGAAGSSHRDNFTQPVSVASYSHGKLECILEFGQICQDTGKLDQCSSRREPEVQFWECLKNVDRTSAVIYWHRAASWSRLLDALHIDTQNMLIGHKKPSVPIFATGLSLLEPIRGQKMDPCSSYGLTASDSPAPIAPHAVSSPQSANNASLPEFTGRTMPQDIPDVGFDWVTCGLTNPLSIFQSDVSPAGTGCRPHLMEDILSNAKSTAFPGCHGNDESQMSAEAVRVVADMPDIRFMLSRVLMFPVRQ